MPKNKGAGGKKFRKSKKARELVSRQLVLKEKGQDYAKTIQLLGNSRLRVRCNDGKECLCIIPGSMRKRQWIAKDDIILISIRGFQEDKVDVIYVYKPPEVRKLQKQGHLSKELIDEAGFNSNSEDEIIWEDDDEKPNFLIPSSSESSSESVSDDETNKKQKIDEIEVDDDVEIDDL